MMGWDGSCPAPRRAAYLGDHVLHQPGVQFELPLAAFALHVVHVTVGAVSSIVVNMISTRAVVGRTLRQRGGSRGGRAHVHDRLNARIVWLIEQEIVRELNGSN